MCVFFSCFEVLGSWGEQGSVSSTLDFGRETGELIWFLSHLLEFNNETSSDLESYRYTFMNKSF